MSRYCRESGSCLNESPYEKVGKSRPETSPQPCGRNGCFARTSRRLHAELYTPTTSTPIKSSDKGRNHASDTPYLRHVPGSHTNKDPRRVLSKATRRGSSYTTCSAVQVNQVGLETRGLCTNSAPKPEPAKAQPRRTAELALRILTQQALTS